MTVFPAGCVHVHVYPEPCINWSYNRMHACTKSLLLLPAPGPQADRHKTSYRSLSLDHSRRIANTWLRFLVHAITYTVISNKPDAVYVITLLWCLHDTACIMFNGIIACILMEVRVRVGEWRARHLCNISWLWYSQTIHVSRELSKEVKPGSHSCMFRAHALAVSLYSFHITKFNFPKKLNSPLQYKIKDTKISAVSYHNGFQYRQHVCHLNGLPSTSTSTSLLLCVYGFRTVSYYMNGCIIDCISYRRARWDACTRNFTCIAVYKKNTR